MKGYRNKNVDPVDSAGWFHTEDLGFIDDDGFLTVIGRKKEMIVTSSGKKVWPEHIEALLNGEQYIKQSMIIGNHQKFISAIIVPDRDEILKQAWHTMPR